MVVYYLRFLVLDVYQPKNTLRFCFAVFVFFMVRMGETVFYYNLDEVIIHRFYQENVISIKQKGNVVFWVSSRKNEDKIRQFVINPYLTSRRANRYEIKEIPKNSKAFVFEGKTIELNE